MRMRTIWPAVVIKQKKQDILSEPIIMYASCYLLSECGRDKEDKNYGRTTLGTIATAWRTVGASKDLPLGTKLYIPYFKNESNKGFFVVEDRGGAFRHKTKHLDIFMESKVAMDEFGMHYLPVYIIK
jgi:3D (Asp-Asp-Asp) domain-containing protein